LAVHNVTQAKVSGFCCTLCLGHTYSVKVCFRNVVLLSYSIWIMICW